MPQTTEQTFVRNIQNEMNWGIAANAHCTNSTHLWKIWNLLSELHITIIPLPSNNHPQCRLRLQHLPWPKENKVKKTILPQKQKSRVCYFTLFMFMRTKRLMCCWSCASFWLSAEWPHTNLMEITAPQQPVLVCNLQRVAVIQRRKKSDNNHNIHILKSRSPRFFPGQLLVFI